MHSDRAIAVTLFRPAALIAVVTFLVFAPSLSFDFLHSDDDVNVFENVHIRTLDATSLKWMLTDFEQAIRFKPLTWFGWALLYQAGGLEPFAYHLANVTLHALNAALLFLLLGRFLPRITTPFLVLGTLAWSLHPLRVEPVAWVTGFPYHLTTLFMLLALLAYERTDPARSAFAQRCYWLAFAGHALALAAYPIALGFTAGLVAIDLLRLPVRSSERFGLQALKRRLVEKLPFALSAGLVTLVTVLNRYQVDSPWGAVSQTNNYDFAQHAFQAAYVWTYYLWKPLFPVALTPIPTELIDSVGITWSFALAACSFVALIGVAIWMAVRRCQLGLGAFLIAHVGLLVPLLGLTEQYHFTSDRYAHVVGIPLTIGLTALLARVPQRAVKLCASGAVAILAALTLGYLPVWEDDITYFGYLGNRLGDNLMKPPVLDRLGDAQMRRENYARAIQAYRGVLDCNPRYVPPSTVFKLAAALQAEGRHAEAEAELGAGLQSQPDNVGGLYVLAQVTASTGRTEEAVTLLQRALQLSPDFTPAREMLEQLKTTPRP